MRSKLQTTLGLLLLLALVLPASAGLFGPPSEIYKGRINWVQPSNFTLLTNEGKLVRIMVALDRKVPPEVQVGVMVEVRAVQGKDHLWYLDKFERIQLQPNG